MKRVSSVFLFLLVATLVYGQYDPKENFYDAEFFFAEEDYPEALYAFTQVYNAGFQDNANINYRIGVCLLNIEGRKKEAVPYLEKAVTSITTSYKEGSFKETNAPSDAYLYLANAYRISNNFDKAIENYNNYKMQEVDLGEQEIYVNLQIDACNRAKDYIGTNGNYSIATLGQLNAIRVPVYNPVLSGDGNTFAFMGRQKFYNGIYVTRKTNGKWSKPYNITPSIQSDGNQTVLAISEDGNSILLSWADQFESDIWISEYKTDHWYKSEPLPKPINSKYYESHACLTPDGNSIYFTSNRRESLGEMDIFRCDKNSDGTWGDLVLLGDKINTSMNEENPFVSPDGKRFYFSSQGHQGYGGFDIYYCDILADGSFSDPVNLGYPLNTIDDDYAFIPKEISYDDYLTFYSRGNADDTELLRFEWIPESAQPVAMEYDIIVIKDEPKPEPVAEVQEEVKEELPVEEQVAETKEVVEEVVEEVKVEEPVKQEVIEPVKEEVVAETYMIKPIFFDFDSYALSSNAKNKLDGIAALMKRFPSVELKITGHTDALGSLEYNQALSRKRAKAVSDYLASKGIDLTRLNIIGAGETDPVAINRTANNQDSPKGRALNRRVQFTVTVPGGALIEIDEVKVPDELKLK